MPPAGGYGEALPAGENAAEWAIDIGVGERAPAFDHDLAAGIGIGGIPPALEPVPVCVF